MAVKAKALTTIKAATIARVCDKVTGKFLCFLVKSDTTSEYYQVRCLKIAGECEFFCNCPATVECKHIRACRELCEARKEIEAEKAAAVAEAEQIIAENKEQQVLAALQTGNFNIVDFSFETSMALDEIEAILKNLQSQGHHLLEQGRGFIQLQKPLARELAPLSTNDDFSLLKK